MSSVQTMSRAHDRTGLRLATVALTVAVLAGCGSTTTAEPSEPGLANPASEHCVEQGGQVEIRADADGAEEGFCVFPDGSECEEFAFFRGECEPEGTGG